MKPEPVPFPHLWKAVCTLLISTVFYSFPRAAALMADTAAPWAVLVSGGVALLLFWPVAAILARQPGKGLTDLALRAGGRPAAIILALLLGGFFIGSAGLGVRQVAEMVVTSLYPHTPQTFAMVSLVVVGALGASMRTGGSLWIGSLLTWPTLLVIAVTLVGSLSWGQVRNVTPVTGHGLLPTAWAILTLTSYFDPLVYLAVLTQYLKTPVRLVRASVLSVSIAVVVWSGVVLLFLMVFPLPGGVGVPFPLFEMTRLVEGGRFFERLDIFWLFFWTLGSALRLTLALMTTSILLKEAFRMPDPRAAVLPLTMATIAIALFPSNQAGAIASETLFIRQWGFVPGLLLPLAVALGARLRDPHA